MLPHQDPKNCMKAASRAWAGAAIIPASHVTNAEVRWRAAESTPGLGSTQAASLTVAIPGRKPAHSWGKELRATFRRRAAKQLDTADNGHSSPALISVHPVRLARRKSGTNRRATILVADSNPGGHNRRTVARECIACGPDRAQFLAAEMELRDKGNRAMEGLWSTFTLNCRCPDRQPCWFIGGGSYRTARVCAVKDLTTGYGRSLASNVPASCSGLRKARLDAVGCDHNRAVESS